MNLQLGLLHLDGRPASQDDWCNLLGGFADTSTEIAGEIADGSFLMVYRGDKITSEDEFDVQPLRSGPYIMSWDGRLDNRQELANRVGLPHWKMLSDSQIVLTAYERVGDSVFNDLIGEFALTLWCRKTKSLYFARSTCGARTLYYVLNPPKTLIWSSDFAHLVTVTGVDLAVNSQYVVEYLISQPATDVTSLDRVEAVPPNRFVQFRDGRLICKRELWNPRVVSPIRYRTDAEYEEHFLEQITAAIEVRLRAKQPVFSELSGGLDSSTIVLMADRILRNQNRSDHVTTISCIYDQSETCNELPFIQAIEQSRGHNTLLVSERDQRVTLGLDEPPFTGLPNALHCFPGRYSTFSALMRPSKAKVLLTGRGGDHLFWSEPDGTPIVADALRSANLGLAHRACQSWSQVASSSYYETMGRALAIAGENLFSYGYSNNKVKIPSWIASRYERLTSLQESDFHSYKTRIATPSQQMQLLFLEHMLRYLGSGFMQEFRDIYISHPYSHRPLVEFCLAIPISQFLRGGESRSIMRRALREILPPKIVNRVSKGLLDETIARALHREWMSIGDVFQWEVSRRGYVKPAELLSVFQRARLGVLNMLGPLIRVLSLERWLRSLSHVRNNLARHTDTIPTKAQHVFSEVFHHGMDLSRGIPPNPRH